jgi:hypothetical protein
VTSRDRGRPADSVEVSDRHGLSFDCVDGVLIEDGFELRYLGPATVGGTGRALLHHRRGGIGGMVWEALEGAGWMGERTSARMAVGLRVGVPAAPVNESRLRARLEPLRGGARHVAERPLVDDHGVVWQQSVGPLSGRAAGPGFLLMPGDRHLEELEFGENVLYSAAVHAGWLTLDPDEVVDVAEVRITVSARRRNPRWEAHASGDPPNETPSPVAPSVSAQDETKMLAHALEIATRDGDPNPELIQHARGSRFDVTRATGSTVFSDAPSYIFVMKGDFNPRHSRPGSARGRPERHYRFRTLVFDVRTGKITDSGGSNEAPDLTPLGEVITDHPHN